MESRSSHSGLVGTQVRHKGNAGGERGKDRHATDDARADTQSTELETD